MSTTAVIEPIKDPRGPCSGACRSFRTSTRASACSGACSWRVCPDRGLPADRGFRAADRALRLLPDFRRRRQLPAQQAPGGKHLWGTTVGSYDVFSRVVWGAQTAVLVIIVAVLMSIFIGVILGLVSGYIGGWLDRTLVVIADAIYAFPPLLVAIVMAIAISGGSPASGAASSRRISITVVFIPQYFRVIRAETIRLKAEPFVESAKVVGASNIRIMRLHVFKNATRTLPLIFTLNASEAILTLAGLGFLGFGIEPTSAAEWGFDLNKAPRTPRPASGGRAYSPGLAIVLTVLGLTLVGESINDLNDPACGAARRLPPARAVRTPPPAARLHSKQK